MSIKALQEYVFVSKYARYREELGRRETFEESVDRVMDMHEKKYGKMEEIEYCRDAMREKLVLGSQRALQFGGEPITKRNTRLYNCSGSYCDRPRFFQEALWLLLCGCGVGFSVQKHHVDKLPPVVQPSKTTKQFVVPDSIEGWADALGVLLASYGLIDEDMKEFYEGHGTFRQYLNRSVVFDYSEIRPKGSKISYGIGTAPGPEPLRRSLEEIDKLLKRCEGKLRPIDAYDIVMHASDAVLSGGVRRSATLCLFSKDDEEMLKAKTGNWMHENPQRARSNNSVLLLRDSTTEEEFNAIMQSVKAFGEPGFMWADDTEVVYNPCQPAHATVLTKEGIATFRDIDVGSVIWSETGWTKVVRKVHSGVKRVFEYRTPKGVFIGTNNHRVVSKGTKYQVKDVKVIDTCPKPGEAFGDTVEITKIVDIGEMDVYDITVSNKTHTYWSGGLNVSNCGEVSLFPKDINGKSGWSLCNLTEINMKLCTTEDKFMRACIAAAILGTLQAGYTHLTYLGKTSEEIVKSEALLGCSMTGMMDNPDIAFDEALQRKGAKLIVATNAMVAKKIGINQAARTTAVKPAGSTSCILGTSSGIHAHHSRRYFRRVQGTNNEGALRFFAMFNPRAVEKSVWNPNGTDEVLTFCVEAGEEALTKQQVDAVALLERVKLTQSNWVKYGKVEELCLKPWLSHNVSNTINVKKNEWDDVTKFIYNNKHCFTGVALLSHEGDLDYPQAPFCAVKTEEELVEEYGKGVFLASGLIVDGLHAFGDNLWAACDAVIGNGKSLESSNAPAGASPIIKDAYEKVWKDKRDWVRRFKQFTDRYMGGDIRKTSHCLKDVHNFKLWQDLTREYIDIDYKEFTGTNDTNITADAACAGGKCQII